MKNSNHQKSKRLRDKLKENNMLTKAVSIAALLLIIAGLFAFIIIGLRSYDLIELPEFFERLFFGVRDGGEQRIADDSDIYDSLSSARTDDAGFSVAISLENVREIISGINLPDNLHVETAARYYDEGKVSRTVEMTLWKKEYKYKYVLKTNGEPEEAYMNDGRAEYFENYITGSFSRRTANHNFSFESVPHIKDISYYLDLIEGGSITDLKINKDIEEENIIEIIYEINELDQREVIRISLDNGLVLSVMSYAGGVIYYENETAVKEAYFTGHEPENTALTDDIFVIG